MCEYSSERVFISGRRTNLFSSASLLLSNCVWMKLNAFSVLSFDGRSQYITNLLEESISELLSELSVCFIISCGIFNSAVLKNLW